MTWSCDGYILRCYVITWSGSTQPPRWPSAPVPSWAPSAWIESSFDRVEPVCSWSDKYRTWTGSGNSRWRWRLVELGTCSTTGWPSTARYPSAALQGKTTKCTDPHPRPHQAEAVRRGLGSHKSCCCCCYCYYYYYHHHHCHHCCCHCDFPQNELCSHLFLFAVLNFVENWKIGSVRKSDVFLLWCCVVRTLVSVASVANNDAVWILGRASRAARDGSHVHVVVVIVVVRFVPLWKARPSLEHSSSNQTLSPQCRAAELKSDFIDTSQHVQTFLLRLWYTCQWTVIDFACLFRYMKGARRKPVALVPLVPFGFIVAYFGDLAYGNKMHRIRGELHAFRS